MKQEEDIWNDVFQSRKYKEQLISENVQPLPLFLNIEENILVSGKSNEILAKEEND